MLQTEESSSVGKLLLKLDQQNIIDGTVELIFNQQTIITARSANNQQSGINIKASSANYYLSSISKLLSKLNQQIIV